MENVEEFEWMYVCTLANGYEIKTRFTGNEDYVQMAYFLNGELDICTRTKLTKMLMYKKCVEILMENMEHVVDNDGISMSKHINDFIKTDL